MVELQSLLLVGKTIYSLIIVYFSGCVIDITVQRFFWIFLMDVLPLYYLTGNGKRCQSTRKLSHQEVGIAKLSGFCEWLSFHPIIAEMDADENMEKSISSHKMIIFAHHHKVLDRVQVTPCISFEILPVFMRVQLLQLCLVSVFSNWLEVLSSCNWSSVSYSRIQDSPGRQVGIMFIF